MNEARKRALKSEAYSSIYDYIASRIESFQKDAERYSGIVEERMREDPELEKEDCWEWETSLEYEAKAEVYEEVTKEILK